MATSVMSAAHKTKAAPAVPSVKQDQQHAQQQNALRHDCGRLPPEQSRSYGQAGSTSHTQHRFACSPSILDLLDTQLREGVWVISQVEGVEGSTWVQVVQTLHSWALTVCTVGLSKSQQQDLEPQQGACQHQHVSSCIFNSRPTNSTLKCIGISLMQTSYGKTRFHL